MENSQYDLVKSIQLGAGISGSYEGIGLGYNFTTALSKSFSQNTRYGDVKSTCKIQQYQNILTNGVLCNFVTDEFRANTHVMTAQKLFETYGTHLILKFSVGGRLDIEFVTKSHTTKENAQIRQEAQASYLVLTGKNSTEYKEQFAYFNQDCVYKIIGKGGDISMLPSSVEENSQYTSWMSSVERNPTIYEIEELVPIWELAEGDLRDSIELEYYKAQTEYMEKQLNEMLFITDLRVERRDDANIDMAKADDEVVVKFSKEYGGENADCNKNAGGDHIYILYKLGNLQDKKITDIRVNYTTFSSHEPCKSGYTHINTDLNDGAGGRFIYLDYKREYNTCIPGFHALGVRTTTTALNSHWGIIKDADNKPVDLNKGAGGDYLYLFGYVDPLWNALQEQIAENKEFIKKMS